MCWVSWDKLNESKRDGGLGFRDIEAFNDALLAKASWRIIENPNNLLGRMLLGRYCRSTCFLEVNAVTNCSHGWRGLLVGRDFIKRGLIYGVGNGSTVSIWKDPWTPLDKPEVIHGPATEMSQEWTVSQLFLDGICEWDREKISTLLPDRVDEIMRIQPSKLGAPEKLMWTYDKTGQYTTKSGYFQALEMRRETNLNDNKILDFNWNKEIWNAETAPKVHMFLWKAKRNAIPTGENLVRRQILREAKCTRCGEWENTEHTLFKCRYAEEVWRMAPFLGQNDPSKWNSLKEALEKSHNLISLPPVGVKGNVLFLWIVWRIWLSRNCLVFEERKIGVGETISKAIADAREWSEAQLAVKTEENTIEKVKTSQLRNIDENEEATVLIYSDAAWKETDGSAGLGWSSCKRDGTEKIAGWMRKTNVRSSLMAEAIACLEALHHQRALQRNKVTLFSDSLNLIRALTKKDYPMELYGVISDIERLSMEFEFICFSFLPRKENKEADMLAKQALYNLSLCTSARVEALM